MCHYIDVLGEGATLNVQLITFSAIVLSIAFWVWMYRRQNVGLMQYALPIALWIVFGTLDIIITAKGTIGNPMNETNPLTRMVLFFAGDYGPAVASILWISLWSLAVLVMNKKMKNGKLAAFLSLAVFYSLAVGHLFGFSSWFMPLCWISKLPWALPEWSDIAIGCALAAVHSLAAKSIRTDGR
jgi:hypothetical protein